MFYYLEGKVALVEPNLAVIDVNGAGYAVQTTLNTIGELRVGESARLFIHESIREDAFDLYGFKTQEELSCFRMLISISGVGPKAAAAILSAATPEQLALAVITGDERTLTSAQGIGKKIAQRIILELGDKMKKEQLEAAKSAGGAFVPLGGAAAEAEQALSVLGFDRSEISAALKGIDASALTTEEIVALALKKLSRQ